MGTVRNWHALAFFRCGGGGFSREVGRDVLKPGQYMDKWRLDRQGVRVVDNAGVKKALGFN